MRIREVEALRELLLLRRTETVDYGKTAFVEENPASAREQADRLDRLHRAEEALREIEIALSQFPEIPKTSFAEDRAVPRRSVILPDHAGKEITMEVRGVKARARWTGESVTVLEGSMGTMHQRVSMPEYLASLRQTLIRKRHIEVRGGSFFVLQDLHFQTPSAASSFLCGRSSNGRAAWKLEDGQPLGTILEPRR